MTHEVGGEGPAAKALRLKKEKDQPEVIETVESTELAARVEKSLAEEAPPKHKKEEHKPVHHR
jgi:hypothetical protein